MIVRAFAWPRLSQPSDRRVLRGATPAVRPHVKGSHRISIRLRLQHLFSLTLSLLVLISSALGAHAEEAVLTKTHRVKTVLSNGGKYLRENQVEQAISQFKKAVSLDPHSAEAHMLLGYAYRVQGRYELLGEAKAELRQALALDPTLVWARFYLATIYVDFGRLQDASTQLDSIVKSHPEIPQVLALLGEVKRQSGDPALSVEHNRKALELSPTLTTAHYHLGLAYLDLKREKEALRELTIAASSQGANADVHLALGSLYLEQNILDRAIQSFNKALEVDSLRPEGHLKLAKAYRLEGWLDRALAELRLALQQVQSLRRSPYFQEVRAELFFESGLIHEQKQSMSKAIEAYLNALNSQPRNGDAHRRLAKAFFQQGEYGRALEHALRADEFGFPIDPSLLRSIRDKAKAIR